jgi:hypothetical protein
MNYFSHEASASPRVRAVRHAQSPARNKDIAIFIQIGLPPVAPTFMGMSLQHSRCRSDM